MNYIVLCVLLNWGIPAHTIKGCKSQFRRAGVYLSTQDVCEEEFTSDAWFYPWSEGHGAGMGKLDTYSLERGWVKIWLPNGYSKKKQRRFINRVLCHEIGHNLGMEHNYNPRSIMYWTTKNVMKKQRFTRKDLKALEKYK